MHPALPSLQDPGRGAGARVVKGERWNGTGTGGARETGEAFLGLDDRWASKAERSGLGVASKETWGRARAVVEEM